MWGCISLCLRFPLTLGKEGYEFNGAYRRVDLHCEGDGVTNIGSDLVGIEDESAAETDTDSVINSKRCGEEGEEESFGEHVATGETRRMRLEELMRVASLFYTLAASIFNLAQK